MSKKKMLNVILVILSVHCPILFVPGFIGFSLGDELRHSSWLCWAWPFSVYIVFASGLVGFFSLLALSIINRKQIKSLLICLVIALLLIINIRLSYPFVFFKF